MIIFGMDSDCSATAVTSAENVSCMVFICITAYMMFGLAGDTDTTSSFFIEIILVTSFLNFTVAVAVSAIIFTLAGKRLLISPTLENNLRNVSPLYRPICKDNNYKRIYFIPGLASMSFINHKSSKACSVNIRSQHISPLFLK